MKNRKGRRSSSKSQSGFPLGRPGIVLLAVFAISLFAFIAIQLRSSSKGAATSRSDASLYDSRNLIDSRESPYSNVYVYKTGPNVSMTFGLNKKIYTESIYNSTDEMELPVPYTQYMTAAFIYPKNINSILEIGLGGGRTAWYLHRVFPNAQITTVELDPAVIELSKKYFGIKEEPNFKVVNADGRLFLADSKEKYDVILVDAYRGPFVPFHLLTKEFYQLVKAHLALGGVVAQNIESSTMLYDSAVKTINEVFPQVELYETGDGNFLRGQEENSNIVTVAYDGPHLATSDITRLAEKQQSIYKPRYELTKMLDHRYTLRPVEVNGRQFLDVFRKDEVATGGISEDSKVMTDDFAPVESLKAIERHNQTWKQ